MAKRKRVRDARHKRGREPNGRRRRDNYPVPVYDKGVPRVQMMQAIYGADGSDAIGRVYRLGLLGEGDDAKALLDTARRLHNAYWAAYGTGRVRSALGEPEHGSVASVDHEAVKRREDWLNLCLDRAKLMGRDADRAFRQLVIDINPDCGPDWADRLCEAAQRGRQGTVMDRQRLALAVNVLRAVGRV